LKTKQGGLVPNWCSNRLTVSGERDEVIRFLEIVGNGNSLLVDAQLAARAIDPDKEQQISAAVIQCSKLDDMFSFNGHVPEPELEGDGWYNWRIENWGTKWDASDASLGEMNTVDDQSSVEFYFQTPWGPAADWLIAVAKAHPTLQLEMVWNEEQGIGGVFNASQGLVEHTSLEMEQIEKLWSDAPYTEEYFEDEEPETTTV
jgi:hypothetical protein